ncbi:MAG: TIM-barrel domain-containing protein [Bacteroidota bacterium]
MRYAYLISLLFLPFTLFSQVLRVTPSNPRADDIVSVVFDASKGNKALLGYTGEVYAHTGLILGTVDEPSDWRYVQGNWGKADDRMKMERIGPDLYQIQFQIKNFYGFSDHEPFLQMAFVFRNENGSLVAKDNGDKDIFYPKYQVFENGPLENAHSANANFMDAVENMQELENGSIYFSDGEQSILLKSYGEGILNVTYFPDGELEERGSSAVVIRPEPFRNIYDGNTHDPYRLAGADPFNIRLHQAPTRLEFLDGNRELLLDEDGFFYQKNFRGVGQITGVRFQLSDEEHLYGMGARAIDQDLNGKRLYTYNSPSYGYAKGEDNLNLSIPLIISSKGYGIFFDNPRKAYLDMGKKEPGVLEYGVKDSNLSYYIILGPEPAKIVERYTRLTGRQSMPPKWALGFIQGRNGYKNQFEAERIVKRSLAAGYPIDAILLDKYWFGGEEKMGNMDWDRKIWPNPERMISSFREKGIHTILSSDPYIVQGSKHFGTADKGRLFATNAKGNTRIIADFPSGPAALLDVFNTNLADWMWPQYFAQMENGVSAWASQSSGPNLHPRDMVHKKGTAEEVHNLYSLKWSRILYEKFKQDYPEVRFFNIQSSGYAGVQRFGTIMWSGQAARSWNAYKAQIPIILGSGLSGVGYMHSGIGGYTGGPKDPELYRRWMQLGAFSPIMRVYGEEGVEPEPIFYDPYTQRAVKKAIQLRYRLLPYNYQLAYENNQKGTPLARPLMYEIPEDPASWEVDDQYFWGPALMVAPVLERGQKLKEIYFPKGEWFNFYTEELIVGGARESFPLKADEIPLFVKRGSWIPMANAMQNTSEFKGDSLNLHYYPNPESEFDQGEFYWDNGLSETNFLQDDYKKFIFTGKVKGYKVFAQIRGEGKMKALSGGVNILLHIHGFSSAPESVKVFGKKIMLSDQASYIKSPGPEAAWWDFERNTLVVKVNWLGADTMVEVKGYLK